MKRSERWLLIGLALGLLGAVLGAHATREREVPLARFATSLEGRTPNQVHNLTLAARAVDGTWLQPGEEFSFNRTVGHWTQERGYKRAPVSYDGELVPSWGGGVCQASTTLYNAGLLAGLTLLERHRHHWVTQYAAPGRDAAVAQHDIDLRFRNDHPWPVRLEGQVRERFVEFRVLGPEEPSARYEIRQEVAAIQEPLTVFQPRREDLPRAGIRNPGRPGARVRTYRVELRAGRETARELLSDDTYPAMNRLILGGDPPPAR